MVAIVWFWLDLGWVVIIVWFCTADLYVLGVIGTGDCVVVVVMFIGRSQTLLQTGRL